jgi:hypothetical protein
MASTVGRPQAKVLAACARRKARHDECVRYGAGWTPASSSTLLTEVAETGMPRPLSSPTIVLYPQCGFSLASRRISSRSERVSGGRAGNRCEYVHRRAMSWQCQRSSVSGLIGRAAQAARGSERLRAAAGPDPLVPDAASRAVGGGSPAHGGGRGSPTPLSDPAAPATPVNRFRTTGYRASTPVGCQNSVRTIGNRRYAARTLTLAPGRAPRRSRPPLVSRSDRRGLELTKRNL